MLREAFASAADALRQNPFFSPGSASQSPARDSSAGNKTRKKYPACLQMLDPELRMSDLLIGWFCAG